MYNRLRFVLRKNLIEFAAIPNIAYFERPPFDELGGTGRKVVMHDRREALIG